MLVVVMKRTEKQPGTRQITDYRSSLLNLWISFIIKAVSIPFIHSANTVQDDFNKTRQQHFHLLSEADL